MRIDLSNGEMSHITHPGIKLKGKDKYKKLYHYTSFDTFLKIFFSKKLKYGEPVNVNDILEANKTLLIDNLCQIPLLFALRETINSYKQLSFTMDYDSMLKGCMSNAMWYHYGDNRKGVCIEFDFDKLKLPSKSIHGLVKYKYLLKNNLILPKGAATSNDVEKYVEKNIKRIFFEKTKDWKYENEYRIICQGQEYLDITGAISSVYFTNCDSEYVKVVEMISEGEFPIRYITAMTENGELTPIDYGTESMRLKYESIDEKNKGKISLMQQAQEFYEVNKSDKNKSLLMHKYKMG